jgi:hypothetical protein
MMVIARDAERRFPPQPMRCPYCRLTVAAGRGQFDLDHVDRTAGSASGVLAHAARRQACESIGPDEVADALEFVARETGTPVQRLRMIDYERLSGQHDSLPQLASILEECGTWKGARRMVDEGRASPKAARRVRR